MTNEDQNSHNEETMNEDNLMAELQQFNEGSSPEVEEVQESTEEVQELQSDENSANDLQIDRPLGEVPHGQYAPNGVDRVNLVVLSWSGVCHEPDNVVHDVRHFCFVFSFLIS